MSRSWARVLGVIVVVAMSASACGDSDDTAEGSSTTAEGSSTTEPAGDETCTADRRGGEITMGTFSQPVALDPVRGGGNGRTGGTELAAIYDTLMRYDAATGEYHPRIAESVEQSADGLEWTVNLRDDVTYGNGDELIADDVKWSFERAQSDENVTPNKGVAQRVTEIEVVDDHTLLFSLDTPWSDFPWLLSSQVGMVVNPRVFEATNVDDFGLMPPVGAGAGAYEVERFAPGDEIVLTAKDSYWDGNPCIETLTFVRLDGAQPTYEALTNDEFDVAFISTDPLVTQEARAAGYDGLSFPIDAANVILMNSGYGTEPITTDPRVRQAVALALDPELYNDRLFEGAGTPSSNLLHPDSRLYPGVDGPEADPDEARALIEQVQADTDWDGTVRLDCSENNAEQAIEVEGQLEAAGFDVEMTNTIQIPEFLRLVTVDGNYELACWAVSVKDQIPLLALGQFTTGNPANYWGYSNEVVDDAIPDLAAADSDEEAQDALARIQEAWNEGPPVAVLTRGENFIATADHVKGLVPTADWIALLSEAYVDGSG